MDIGTRIKQRRETLQMSQDELAKRVGYKSRSSINKIESDGRGLPQNKIVAFANALDTTPAHLMGWDPRPDILLQNQGIVIEHSSTQHRTYERLMKYFELLNDEGKRKVLEYASDLSHNPKYCVTSSDMLQAAHERTDVEVTDEMRKHDDDIMNDDNF